MIVLFGLPAFVLFDEYTKKIHERIHGSFFWFLIMVGVYRFKRTTPSTT